MNPFAAFCLAVVSAAASPASVPDDEPDALSYELFSQDPVLLRHFFEWAGRNPPPADAPAAAAPRAHVPYVWIKPAHLPTGNAQWKPGKVKGVEVLHGALWMNLESAREARIPVEIPADGEYRFWVRYHHVTGRVETTCFRLTRAPEGELRDDTGGASFTLLEEVFSRSQQFPHSNGQRPLDPIPTAAVLPTTPSGFRWEGTRKTAFLRKGRYLVRLRGGSFGSVNPRRFSDFLFTADPLYAPTHDVTRAASAFERRPPTPAYAARLYALRPGGVSAPSPSLRAWWKRWRGALLADLVRHEHSSDYEWGFRASQVYFDEDRNLIGRASEIRAQDRFDALPGVRYSFTNAPSGTFDAVQPGRYVFWARFDVPFRTLLRDGQTNVTVRAGGRTVASLDLRLLAARRGRSFQWRSTPLFDLPRGRVEVALGGDGTNRIACAHLTTRTDFNPLRAIEFPCGAVLGGDDVGWWRADPFAAFTRCSTPGTWEDVGYGGFLGEYGLDSPRSYAWRGLDPATVNRTRYGRRVRRGETASEMIVLRNNTDRPVVFSPAARGTLPATVRLVASTLNSNGTWTPKILLRRREMTLPPRRNLALWLSIDCRGARAGAHDVTLSFAGRTVTWDVTVEGSIEHVPAPWMNPWCAPMLRESCFEAFRDLGMNMTTYIEVPKATTSRYGIRMVTFVPFECSDARRTIREAVARERDLYGRTGADYCVRICDEPDRAWIPKWMEIAREIRAADPGVLMWYNSAFFPTNRADFAALKPFMDTWDVVCSFYNCFTDKKEARAPMMADYKALGRLKLVYNTFDTGNCENAPGSPLQIFRLAEFARREGRDGWSPHNLGHGWAYDDVYATCNTIFLYPGARLTTLTTRGAEAVREANQRWRAAK